MPAYRIAKQNKTFIKVSSLQFFAANKNQNPLPERLLA
jgi:hypothetical protein